MKYQSIIPLGEACSTAIMLKELGLRPFSLPLDWLAYQTPQNLLSTISDNFSSFFPSEEEINKEYIRKNDLYQGLFAEIDTELAKPNQHFPTGAPPFCDFFNIDSTDRSRVRDKWEEIKSDALPFGIKTLEAFLREFKFRNYFGSQEREEFVFTNGYQAECMHDFHRGDFKDGCVSPEAYSRVLLSKEKRISRLEDLLSQDHFVAVHISDTFFLDEKEERFGDMCALSELLHKKYGASNFKILCFNLLPSTHKEGRVFNFFQPWDLYKDSCAEQRAFAKTVLLKEIY